MLLAIPKPDFRSYPQTKRIHKFEDSDPGERLVNSYQKIIEMDLPLLTSEIAQNLGVPMHRASANLCHMRSKGLIKSELKLIKGFWTNLWNRP